jgi:CTP synthase (UTP-ammonia lyase)
VIEKFNCNYSLKREYRDTALQFAGISSGGGVRIIEIPRNRFFMAMLFQPQLSSIDGHAHQVFVFLRVMCDADYYKGS